MIKIKGGGNLPPPYNPLMFVTLKCYGLVLESSLKAILIAHREKYQDK